MKTLASRFPLLPVDSFASFAWPRMVAVLPRGNRAARLRRYTGPLVGPYYSDLNVVDSAGHSFSFYLDSDFQPFTRWQWCDTITPNIRHTCWHTDSDGSGDKIRGLVVSLPHGRFLAGWSMGKNMASSVDRCIYHSAFLAAYAADSMAERAAEEQREYDESHAEEMENA